MSEIEQKFLYRDLPKAELQFERHTVVYRKYLCTNPEVRINRRWFETGEERYHLTVKSTECLNREEIKIKLTKEQFLLMDKMIVNDCIVMDVYEYRYDEQHLLTFKKCRDLDIQFAEIEYNTLEEYEKFGKIISQLECLDREVTYDAKYYMRNIWEVHCGRNKNNR